MKRFIEQVWFYLPNIYNICIARPFIFIEIPLPPPTLRDHPLHIGWSKKIVKTEIKPPNDIKYTLCNLSCLSIFIVLGIGKSVYVFLKRRYLSKSWKLYQLLDNISFFFLHWTLVKSFITGWLIRCHLLYLINVFGLEQNFSSVILDWLYSTFSKLYSSPVWHVHSIAVSSHQEPLIHHPILYIKVIMQGKLIAVECTLCLRIYRKQFSLGGICKHE